MQTENKLARIKNILVSILVLNWFVSFIKLFLGYVIKSNAVLADGYHSFSDGTSNIIGLLGIWFASRPKDEDHPYGHRKYETFSSLGIAFLLFLVCIRIISESINRFNNPVIPKVTIFSFVVIFFTLLVNVFVMRYEYRAGKRLKSDILVADSLHTKADIFTSISVIAALIAVKIGWPILDPVIAIIITVFIGHAAFDILKDSSLVLCDSAVIDKSRIEELVIGIDMVCGVHKIRTRGRCDDVHVDLHVQVKRDMHMEDAHKLSYEIEDVIKRKIPGVSDVVVHMEPNPEG